MEWSWSILIWVACFNLCYVIAMWRAQYHHENLPKRHSLIPGTLQPFMHVQDWHCMMWGDTIGLTLVWTVFVHLAANDFVSWWQWLIMVPIAIIDMVAFQQMCLNPKHKPDQGYPKSGETSLQGWLHLPYHGFGVAMAFLVIGHLVFGHIRGAILWVCVIGATIYIASFIADMRAGHFDPIKYETEDDRPRTPAELRAAVDHLVPPLRSLD